MSRGKLAVFLLTILVLTLSTPACTGFTSQGPQEQKRPAENQSSAREDTQETVLQNPEKSMEETAKEEQSTR
jgi:hypothetical protein